MSQAQYENLMEDLHIRQSKTNYEWLKESIKQAEEGKLIFKVPQYRKHDNLHNNNWHQFLSYILRDH